VGGKIKSHRPITPFLCAGGDVYNEPTSSSGPPRFWYPNKTDILQASEVPAGAIDDQSGVPLLNLMGRTHKGKNDGTSGGSANCGFVDGHVRTMSVLETIDEKAWGTRFFTLTGDTRVSATAGGAPLD
jgi:prepilin-type processing-associated H-X9-DG protein